MVRSVRRSPALLVVAIALAGLMAAPVDECDDYAFALPGAVSACADPAESGPEGSVATADPGPDRGHFCSCVVCELATNDSSAPSLPAPRRGETVSPLPEVGNSSTYFPTIFRPPIA